MKYIYKADMSHLGIQTRIENIKQAMKETIENGNECVAL